MKRQVILVLFLIPFLFTISYANIGFMGSEISSNEISIPDEISILSNLVNRDDTVKADIKVIYELRNKEDMSLHYEESMEFSFAENEVKQINHTLNLNSIPQGEYVLNVQVRGGSGSPLSFIEHDLTINNDNFNPSISFNEMPYLKVYYPYEDGRERYELSYSNTGKPIIPNETFQVMFSLDSQDLEQQNYNVTFNLRDSYSNDDPEEIYSQDIIVENQTNNEFSINYSMEEAGTYDLFVSIYDDGKRILNKEVRVVIMGQGGTITDVFNHQDTYSPGDNFKLDTDIVGPADAVSVVTNPYLTMEILKDNNSVYREEKTLERLPYNPQSFSFTHEVEEELENYKVIVSLGKGEKEYDRVELNYEPLDPKLVMDSQGRIYDPSQKGCFDNGECTEEEKELGNCVDCLKQDNKEESTENNKEEYTGEQRATQTNDIEIFNYLLLVILIFAVVLLVGFKVYLWRSSKK